MCLGCDRTLTLSGGEAEPDDGSTGGLLGQRQLARLAVNVKTADHARLAAAPEGADAQQQGQDRAELRRCSS